MGFASKIFYEKYKISNFFKNKLLFSLAILLLTFFRFAQNFELFYFSNFNLSKNSFFIFFSENDKKDRIMNKSGILILEFIFAEKFGRNGKNNFLKKFLQFFYDKNEISKQNMLSFFISQKNSPKVLP